MTPKQIKAKRQDVEQRIREHDAARKILEAELMGLQHVCTHPKPRTWTHHDYGGGCDSHWVCDDCGLHNIR